MAASYGYDISRPGGHRAARPSSGCTSPTWPRSRSRTAPRCRSGRTSTFLDVYLAARPRRRARSTESGAQELIDDFVIKLRIVRFLRTPEYDELFSGDPTWVTESIGGIGADGRPLVTRTSFRFLQTLYNLGPAPEPNLTVLWSPRAARGVQAVLRPGLDRHQRRSSTSPTSCCGPRYGDDTAIACCVSAMRGRQADAVLRRPRQPRQGAAVRDQRRPRRDHRRAGRPAARAADRRRASTTTRCWPRYDRMLDWLAETYVDALNVIHYMHDKYAYERLEMALHDHPVHALHGLRHRRPVGRRRQPVGDQVRAGAGAPRRRPGWPSTTRSRASSRPTATTTTAPTRSPCELVETFMAKVAPAPDLPRRRAHASRC